MVILAHPVVVTGIILFSSAGQKFFQRNQQTDEMPKEENSHVEDRQSAESFLRMRMAKRTTKLPSSANHQHSFLQAYWIGAALMIWGVLLGISLLALFGFFMWLASFYMHRRSIIRNRAPANK